MALLTKEQFIAKHGYDPDSQGSPSGMPSAPSAPAGNLLTKEQFIAKHGYDPDTNQPSTPAAQAAPSHPGLENLNNAETFSSQNVKKGEGSGKNGRRTLGEILGNVNRGLEDVATGAGKAVIRTVPNIIATLTPDSMWGKDSILNGESEHHKQFNEALKGKNAGEKIGATGVDIATVALPGAEVGKGASMLAERIPQLADFAANAGKAGKIARAVPKIAGAVAENAAADAVIGKGNAYDTPGSVAKNAGIAGALQVGLGLAGAAGKAIKYAGEAGAARKAEDAVNFAKKFVSDLENGTANKFDEGRMKQAAVDFKTSFQKFVDDAKGKLPGKINEIIQSGDNKLNSALRNSMENTLDINPKDMPGVLDTIWNELGGIGRVGRKGADTAGLADELRARVKPLADQQEQLIASQKASVNLPSMKKNVYTMLSRYAGSPEAKSELRDTIENYFSRLGKVKDGSQISDTPGVLDVFRNNKEIRGKYDYTKMGQKKLFKQIAGAVDSHLFNPVHNPNGALSKSLQTEMMKLYDAADVLDAVHGVNAQGAVKDWFARLIGSVAGFGAGGGPATSYAGGVVGAKVADEINQMAGRVATKGAQGSPATEALSQVKNAKRVQSLKETIQTSIDQNVRNNATARAAKQSAEEAARTVKSQEKTLQKQARDLKSLIRFNKNRIKTNMEIDKIIDEVKTAKSMAEMEKHQATLKELFRQSITETKPMLPKNQEVPLLNSAPEGGPKSRVTDGSVISVPPGGFSNTKFDIIGNNGPKRATSLKDLMGKTKKK